MENIDPKLVLALILFLLLLLLLLLNYFLNRKKSSSSVDSDAESNYGELRQEIERRRREIERPEKTGLLKEILNQADPLVIKQLCQMAGKDHKDLQNRGHESQIVNDIADTLTLEDIKSLHYAVTTNDIKSTSTTTSEIERTAVPTNSIRPDSLTEMDQLASLTPESMTLDDEAFFNHLATNQLQVLQSFDKVIKKGLKAMLLDVSGSMNHNLPSGKSKTTTARGATYRLISDSDAANTEFLLRMFDGSVHPLMKATSEEEKLSLMRLVQQNGFSGGGTNILSAIMQMVRDVRNMPDIDNADITIITDGQDDNVNDVDELKSILGPKISLHVIAIGEENPVLKKVAKSYTYLT